MEPTNAPTASSQDEIDLKELFLALWARKTVIVAGSLSGILLAALYAFMIAKPLYQSSALLLPTQSSENLDFGPAATLLGKTLKSPGDLNLYQSLLTSRAVMQKVLLAPIRNESDTGLGRIEPLFRTLGVDTSNRREVNAAVAGLMRSVTVNSRESGSGDILEIQFSAHSPWLAQCLGNTILKSGHEELRQVRIARSNIILSQLSVAVNHARSEWDSASSSLTWYNARNRSISIPEQLLELSRLETEKAAKEQKYLMARKEYELQLLEQAKAAPPMMILDPADYPTNKIKPRRGLILALGLMLGAVAGCIGALGMKLFVPTAST